tara:strand:+ start:15893 stop:16261 length:369 start_codon:yes stop_codon:yes gene_type:complete
MRKLEFLGACFALLSIILGAFTTHFLKDHLDGSELNSFETGIRYMMYNGLSMLIISRLEISKNFWIFRLFFWGTILFSFSIFLLSIQKIFSINLSFLGPITPVGGALLILGWTIIIYRILKK